MSNIWFTADTHYGHCNILNYCNRPFKDHEEMNEGIISHFNEVLRPGDVLYHLGDIKHSQMTFDNTLGRLNTKEIHLIIGNHDKEKECQRWGKFRSISDIKALTLDGQRVVLCHYAMRTWSSKNREGFQLYGHSHGMLPGLGRQMDVGVDTNNFYPYSYEEVKKRLGEIEFKVTE